jgi:Tol biopolymer transport system component
VRRGEFGACVTTALTAAACALTLAATARPAPARPNLVIQGYYPDQVPSWSSDSRRIAFVRGAIDLAWLAVIDRGAGQPRRVAAGRSWLLWSPDGSRMAILNGLTVWLANGDGSQPKRVGNGSSADWSPDGRLLALDLGGRLHVVKRDGSGLRRLPIDVPTCPTCRSAEGHPAWSPNGHTLAFVHEEAEPATKGSAAVWVADVDGQNLRRLSETFNAEDPEWSPDGTKVAYLLYDGFSDYSYLHVIDADGSHDRRYRLTGNFSWAPRGNLLAYDSLGRKHVYIVRAGRAGVVGLKAGASPSWAPDGRRLTFQRRGLVYIADAVGRGQRRLVRGTRPSWSANGRLIAYAGTKCGPHQGIHLINPAGTQRRRVTNFCFIVGSPANDRIRGTVGNDRIIAAAGNDRIWVRDDRRDVVNCGAGLDRVIADRLDRLTGCEDVER